MVVAVPGGEETWRGEFGESWLKTLCSAAHCPAARMTPDVVGADLVVHDHSYEMIRIQVKTTESPHRTAVGFRFDLDVPTYERLRQGSSPGFLVLVVLHRRHPWWTRHFGAGSVVRATAYWSKLYGLGPTPNAVTVTIAVPIANVLTPTSLLDLFPSGGDHGEPA